ncbi:MAG: HAD family hydrolase [Bacteroidota bacterium]
MNYQAVIFDLDGTLLDTLEDLADSVNLVLQHNNLPGHELHKYKYFIGDGLTNLVRRVLPVELAGDDATVTRYLKAVSEEYNKRWSNKTRPYTGIPELLRALKDRGVRTAVFTNKPDPVAQEVIRHFFPDFRFEIVRGATPSQPIKPHPAGALAIATEMNLPPNQFLYLGDTGTDMKTANAAGMYPVGVLWGFRTGEELIQNGAKILLEKPEQLLDKNLFSEAL